MVELMVYSFTGLQRPSEVEELEISIPHYVRDLSPGEDSFVTKECVVQQLCLVFQVS